MLQHKNSIESSENGSSIEKTEIRPAGEEDVGHIREILEVYSEQQLLLGRSREDILSHLGNFFVAYSSGVFAGCVALRDFGSSLYEVRSLAVTAETAGRGLGSALVGKTLDTLSERGKNCKVFALTLRPELFRRLGFRLVSKDMFPEKIWSDCSVCPKKDHCDEFALLYEINPESSQNDKIR